MLLSPRRRNAVSPGIGLCDRHARFALIENDERTRQALRGIKQMLAKGVMQA